MAFTVFVDESGEAGIKKVRSEKSGGASPYFVISAVVMQPATMIAAKQMLDAVKSEIGKKNWKHATDLGHPEKVLIARRMADLHVRVFSVVSNKSTLGVYKEFIDANPQKFYNKCTKYLLEIVCGYLLRFGGNAENISVILERRNHDYDAMIRYLMKVKENPIYPESRALSALNPFSISTRAKGEEPLLEFADFAAHAVYQCVNKTSSNYRIPETRYFEEIVGRFAGDDRGMVLGSGIKCIHSLNDLELDEKVISLFRNARCTPSTFRV
ncbi:DUF3800 domain-containing protein [Nioella sp. MMSF_3534]|uniref:DUF3800 domain-containing protein n=1 Tax=Nioella sp. MMSF_3534 TaxID=3046720 RepID=UPI00273FD5EB|nr:DUF3800 domain-containing protein [Nioella sp. MMSF_3534]